MIELLAPAGDLEKLKIALLYGADAVYVGGQNYSLRANAKNFSLEDLEKGISFAHSLKKKVYVTVNIIFHDEDFLGLEEYLKYLVKINVDAIIVSDIAVIKMVNELNLPLEIHLSTQASVINPRSAEFYKNLGVKRLVLGREASRCDIMQIKKATGLDLECFIHGAMCTSFSGRCVLSNTLTNRDANRGGCAQICRWTFKTPDEQVFSMTSKDLNMVPYIKDMASIGVNSFKVEGRMRGIYYIATIIKTYREILDHDLSDNELRYHLDILNRCANRESTPQFYQELPTNKEQYFLGRKEVSNQDFLGLVIDYNDETKEVTIEQRNLFKIGDIVEFFGPNEEPFTYKIHKIIGDDGDITVANHPNMIVKLPMEKRLQKYDMMRLKMFDKEDYL